MFPRRPAMIATKEWCRGGMWRHLDFYQRLIVPEISKLTCLALCFALAGLAGCETSQHQTQYSYAPVQGVDMGQGCRVAIIAEHGGDVQPLVQKLYELFSGRGYYQLVDRSNMQQTMEERRFGQMSFVNGCSAGSLTGADILIHVQAEAESSQVAPQDIIGAVLAPNAYDTVVSYRAGFRAIRVSSGQVVAARMLELSDKKSSLTGISFNPDADSAPMVSMLRDQAALQMFQSLHP